MIKKNILLLLLSIVILSPLSGQTYEEIVDKALELTENKDFEAAEQTIKVALRKEPGNPNNILLMVNLGTIQRNLGKLEEALISYNVAIEKYPNSAFIRHNRASLYCEMNRFEDALTDYNTMLLANSVDVEALHRRGLIYLSQKNLLAAEEDFEKMLELDADNLIAKAGLAAIMKRRSEWKEAEEVYSYLIYKYANVADLYLNRAECYMELDKLGKALDDVKKTIELGYDTAEVYILKGKIRLAQYDKQFAKEDFLKAKELGANAEYIEELLSYCK